MADIGGNISLSKVETLTGMNYHVWALKVSAILRSRKLFKTVIEDSEPSQSEIPDTRELEKAKELWNEKNDDAFGIIIVTLAPEQAGLFIGETKARVVWNELKRIYAGNVEDRLIDLGLELKNIRMGNNESTDSYINRARNIASKSAALGQPMSSREIVYHVVRGIHPKMESIAAILRSQRSATIEEVQQTLREEEMRMYSRNTQNSANQKFEKAYKAKDEKNNFKGQTNIRKCYVCNKPGHVAKECWHRKGRFNNNRQGKPSEGRKEHANVVSDNKIEHAFQSSAQLCESRSFQSHARYWSLDSGCTSHMTPYLDWLSDVEPVKSEVHLAENGRKIEVEAKGNIEISCYTNNNEKQNIRIYDVLYVPKLKTNLMSVQSLLAKGNTVSFNTKGAEIRNQQGHLICEAVAQNKMFEIETFHRDHFVAPDGCLAACQNTPTSPVREERENIVFDSQKGVKKETLLLKLLWHRRLGHLGEDYLDRMLKQNMVKGISFDNDKLGICEDCVMGKLVQKPFPPLDSVQADRPLELVCMDLCGPFPHQSLGGAKYLYVIVDAFSRRIFVYFLKSKDEVFDRFIEFKNRRENELNLRIKTMRSDNGTEFVNSKFESLLKAEGIAHQKTVPYSPQSNGIAERANRTLLDRARTIMLEAKLPIQFWAEAVATAAYVGNVSPCKRGGSKTPMELWSGSIPNVTHLRVFGCLAYFYIPKVYRQKLSPRAAKGIFLGYSQTRQAYRIYCPEDGQVHEVRTVKFNEQAKGYHLLRRGDISVSDVDLVYIPEGVNPVHDEDNMQNIRPHTPVEEVQEEQNFSREDVQHEDQNLPRKPGRKLGETNEFLRHRHQERLQEHEERLLAQGVRRSERISNRQIHQQEANVSSEYEGVPASFECAMKSPDSQRWKAAMEEELKSMKEHEVWKLVDRPKDSKVLKSKWVFTKKDISDKESTFKARLVAVGAGQRPGIDYDNSYSPVMKLESLRTVLAIASHLNLKIRQFDVKTAYLYGKLDEHLLMEQPEGCATNVNKDKVCELRKSIYGLPQSGRCWYDELHKVLLDIGFCRLDSDPCVYIYRQDNEWTIIGVYVDDLIVIGTDDDITDRVLQALGKTFNLTENTKGKIFLGIEIEEKEDCIIISQEKHVNKILSKYGLADCNTVKTPGDTHQKLDDYQGSPTCNSKLYQEMLGSLMYLSVGTRPDITFSVSQLSQYCKDPREIHLNALKRVYRYIKGSKNMCIVFDRNVGSLHGSADASWCSTQDAKSYTGYIVKLGNSLISWRSKKQSLVTLSTCEAELVAICEGTCELKWVQQFLMEINRCEYLTSPLILHSDSKAAIDWVQSECVSARTKHINRKYFFVRDECRKKNLKLKFTPSIEMDADVLTKNVGRSRHQESAKKLGLLLPPGELTPLASR